MYRTIFLKENEKDIFQALKKQGIKTKVFEHRLADLFNRVYNNYVGYYVFKQDDVVYKMIVLPKTIEPSDSAEKEFVNYLLHYYRINNIYKLDREKKIPDSLLQLAFKSNNSKYGSHNLLDEFQSHRYRAILQAIEDFFKRHKNSKRIKVDYVSQSIKHKLNLKRNIKELDKTKIHQIQSKDVVFSMLATVTYNALKLFVTQKYSGLGKEYGDELFKEVKRLQVTLLKKYKIERGYKLSIVTLQGIKLAKLFSKTGENRQLLVDIKSLFGFEQMYKDDALQVEYKQDLTTTSLFINPNHFYEWYVYDILKRYADASGKSILFDKKEGTETKYFLNTNKKSSNPDYILTDEANKVKVVIDAKWKNVNEFSDVKSSDYLKLKFDTSLIETKGYGVSPYLIYPYIAIDENSFNMLVDDESVFNFNTIEIDMEFEKHGNSLDFDFDTKELNKSIEINSQTEKLKSKSEELSDVITTKRTEIIAKLLNQESLEDKEDILTELDDCLLESANNLNENIEEKISPKIEELLKEYDDILEDDSKKFLKSSSSIYNYYKDKQYEHFDYSMPGSGLWKLIELELNTSFSWFLRIQSSVCDNRCPWTNISNSRRSITQDLDNGKKVKLNQHEYNDKNKLQGLMLGGIDLLLHDNGTRDEFSDVSNLNINFFTNELATFVHCIKDLRNEHAHIKAMSLEKFEELDSLLFSSTDDLSNIQKLLEFKKVIREYIL